MRLGLKETKIRQQAKNYYAKDNICVIPETPTITYEVWRDNSLASDVKIIEISRYGALILNNNSWQVGEEHEIKLAFDGSEAKIKCVVEKVKHNLAAAKFIELPAGIANKIVYRQMKTAQK